MEDMILTWVGSFQSIQTIVVTAQLNLNMSWTLIWPQVDKICKNSTKQIGVPSKKMTI